MKSYLTCLLLVAIGQAFPLCPEKAHAQDGEELGLIEELFNSCTPGGGGQVEALYEGEQFVVRWLMTPTSGQEFRLTFSDLKRVEYDGTIKLICERPGCIAASQIWQSEIVDFSGFPNGEELNEKLREQIEQFTRPKPRTRVTWGFCDFETNRDVAVLIHALINDK